MTMDWDKLRIFHAVADKGSLTHAGDVLHLSQSAVSRQIRALEESLSVTLFHRHARGLILTEQGELLFEATNSMNKRLMLPTSPSIALASSSDWYLLVSRIGSFSWSSSSTPDSMYLLKTNSMNSFCLLTKSNSNSFVSNPAKNVEEVNINQLNAQCRTASNGLVNTNINKQCTCESTIVTDYHSWMIIIRF